MEWILRSVLVYFLFGALGTNSLRRESKEEACQQMCSSSAERQIKTQGFRSCVQDCLMTFTVEQQEIIPWKKKLIHSHDRIKRAVFSQAPAEMSCDEIWASRSIYNFVGVPDQIEVNFYNTIISVNGSEEDHWAANITWSPLTSNTSASNWTHYLILWTGGDNMDQYSCRLVSKNKTSLVLNTTADWKYPNWLTMNISTYPIGDGTYKLGFYKDPRALPVFDRATLPPDVSFNKLTAILLGVMVGILLVVAIVIGVVRRRLSIRSLEDVWISHIRKLPPHARTRIKSTQSELTIIEEENHYYLSYYPENDEYVNLVIKFVCFLRELNFDVIMDGMSADVPQDGPIRWAQQQISTSSKIIVLCSPSYLKLAQKSPNKDKPKAFLTDEESRVWYEIEMLGSIYTQRRNANKMVCIWMNNGIPEGLPPWMHVQYKWPAECYKIFERLEEVTT